MEKTKKSIGPKCIFEPEEINNKFRLVAYYSGETQNMKPEMKYMSEADVIKPLIARSYKSLLSHKEMIVDKTFVDCLDKRTVFTFEDEQGHLISYFPIEDRVRISNIRINKAARRPPYQVKTLFKLGDPWYIVNPTKIRQELKVKISGAKDSQDLLLWDYAITTTMKGLLFKKHFVTISGKTFPNGSRFSTTLPFYTESYKDLDESIHSDVIGFISLTEQKNKWCLTFKKNQK